MEKKTAAISVKQNRKLDGEKQVGKFGNDCDS